MIFLSHNYKDKEIVEPIAIRLKQAYGENDVFYDSWSIKPGDDIINKMNEGLKRTNFFFYFISQNSLESKMVDLEWQAALYKKAKENITFVPIKIDNSIPPQILLSTLYIDMYNVGFEAGLRQIFDVINNTNSKRKITKFSNIQAIVTKKSNSDYDILIEAKYFFEPNTRFAVIYNNNNLEIQFNLINETVEVGGQIENMELNNGTICNGRVFSLMRSFEPNFPIKLSIKGKNNNDIKGLCIMQAKSQNKYEGIPTIER